MAFNIVIKEEAAADTDEAYRYYEAQSIGLGGRFLDELGMHLEILSETPHHYSFFYTSSYCRSHSIDMFPYAIIYEIVKNDVIVYAVFNTYKNPATLLKSLPK